MSTCDYDGMVFIGDPHIEGRSPDFRSDDYPTTILEKLSWILRYSKANKLLPIFLGDIFDKPRDNPTWIVGSLIEMLRESYSIGIYGNHDCAEPTLNENDTLTLLIKSGCYRLVTRQNPWRGTINGRLTLVGGSSYREEIPNSINVTEFSNDSLFPENPFGVWLSHHDIISEVYSSGRFSPFEIDNVDLLVNGHIHTRGPAVKKGCTTWLTPGNIARRSRSTKCQMQEPAVLKVCLTEDDFVCEYVTIPHRPFEKVFHDPICDISDEDRASAFVAGLSELRLRKTSSGAGLTSFLRKNLEQFSDPVADEIKALAIDVTGEAF